MEGVGSRGYSALYYLGIACLFTHELDAVTHSEWRLLFVLGSMPDDTASPLFVVLHVPLFFAILWLGDHRRDAIRKLTRVTVAAFLVVHAILHFALSSNPQNEFHGVLSQFLIVSAGLCGAAYLLLQGQMLRRSSPGGGRSS